MSNKLVTKTVRELVSKIGSDANDIARKLNVSEKSLHRWLQGDCAPSAYSLMSLYYLAEGHPLEQNPKDVFIIGQRCLIRI